MLVDEWHVHTCLGVIGILSGWGSGGEALVRGFFGSYDNVYGSSGRVGVFLT